MKTFPVVDQSVRARVRSRIRWAVVGLRTLGRPASIPGARGFILCYHRVLPRGTRLEYPIEPGMVVTAEAFERQLRILRERYRVVSTGAFFEEPDPGDPRPLCCIQFDDGWRDNYTIAFALLRKYDLPATIHLATGFIGTREWFWPERFAWAAVRSDPSALREMVQEISRAGTGPAPSPEHDLNVYIAFLKKVSPEVRIQAIGKLEARAGLDPAHRQRLTLSWEEVREMSRQGISFGVHTHNHVILTQVPLETVREELATARTTIREQAGLDPVELAYPNGDYNPAIRGVASDLGFRYAVTTESGWVRKDTDPLAIPRICIHNDVSETRAEFLERIVVGG